MIVCSCNVLSEHDVRMVLTAERAPTTTSEIYACLGCSARCGRCAGTIRQILHEAVAESRVPRAPIIVGDNGRADRSFGRYKYV
jgi:bacterioferritin-associated ferredoxin